MTDKQSIIELVKELRDTKVLNEYDYVDFNDAVLDNFPRIAQALLIAYGPLHAHEHLVRGECLAGCAECEALAAIRSL